MAACMVMVPSPSSLSCSGPTLVSVESTNAIGLLTTTVPPGVGIAVGNGITWSWDSTFTSGRCGPVRVITQAGFTTGCGDSDGQVAGAGFFGNHTNWTLNTGLPVGEVTANVV